MGKKKKQEIDINKIESVKLNINFSVPKEQFDELLRRMAHLTKEVNPQESDKEVNEKKKD